MHAMTSRTRKALITGSMDADSALMIFFRDLIRPKSLTTLRGKRASPKRLEVHSRISGCYHQLNFTKPPTSKAHLNALMRRRMLMGMLREENKIRLGKHAV